MALANIQLAINWTQDIDCFHATPIYGQILNYWFNFDVNNKHYNSILTPKFVEHLMQIFGVTEPTELVPKLLVPTSVFTNKTFKFIVPQGIIPTDDPNVTVIMNSDQTYYVLSLVEVRTAILD